MNTNKKILRTIKEGDIQPKSRLFFALTYVGMWFVWTLTILTGAGVTSAIIFKISNSGFEHIHLITTSHPHFILSSFPFLWVSLIIISTIIAHFEFRKTERGHIVPWWAVVCINIALSVLIGIGMFFSGFGYVGEQTMLRIRGKTVEHAYLAGWHDPENGRLAGSINTVTEEILSLTDSNGNGHIVDISGLGTIPIPTNVPVRIIGVQTDDGDFYACHLLPVRFRGAFDREEVVFRKVDEIKIDTERTTLCEGIRPY